MRSERSEDLLESLLYESEDAGEEDEAILSAQAGLETLIGTSSAKEEIVNAILAASSLAQKHISEALSPKQGVRRFVLFEEIFGGGFENVLPPLRFYSPVDVNGKVEFFQVKKESVLKYIEKKLREILSEFGEIDEEKFEGVKILEADWREELPSGLNALVAAYKLARSFQEAGIPVSYADVLGLSQKVSKGSDPEVKIETSSTDSLPGLSVRLSYRCHVTDIVPNTPYDLLRYNLSSIYPKPARYLIKSVALLQFLDYLFGYSYGSSELSPAPLHTAVLKDDLYKLYFEGPVPRNRIDEYFSRVLSPEEVLDGLKSSLGVPDSAFTSERSTVFDGALVESGLMEFLAKIGKAYLKDEKLPVVLASKDMMPALAFISSLGAVSTRLPEARNPLQALSGKRRISFSDVRETYYKSVEVLARAMGGAAASTLPERVSSLLKSGLSSAFASDENLRNKIPVKLAEHFRSVTSKVVAARLAEGAKGFYISFQPSFSDTAYAAVYSGEVKGEGDVFLYVINLNPKYFLDTSITSGVDFSTLVYSILYHEFLHIYLRHTSREAITKSKAFGDTRIIGSSIIEGAPSGLNDLVPENVSNLHTDAIINSMSLQMAKYVALAQAYVARKKRGTLNPATATERMKRLLSTSFFINHALGEVGSIESVLPTLAVVRASSPKYVNIEVLSPGSKGYEETFRNIRNLRHFSLYLPGFRLPATQEFSDPLFLENTEGVYPGADGALSLLPIFAILAAEGLVPFGEKDSRTSRTTAPPEKEPEEY